MRIPGHDLCFVCGRNSRIGLDFEERDGWMCATFRPTEEFQSFKGIIHGGIIASVLAEAMGMAVSLLEGRFLGKRIGVEYHAPVRPGRRYRVCGKVVRREGRKIFAVAEIYDSDGKVCADAEGLFIALP